MEKPMQIHSRISSVYFTGNNCAYPTALQSNLDNRPPQQSTALNSPLIGLNRRTQPLACTIKTTVDQMEICHPETIVQMSVEHRGYTVNQSKKERQVLGATVSDPSSVPQEASKHSMRTT